MENPFKHHFEKRNINFLQGKYLSSCGGIDIMKKYLIILTYGFCSFLYAGIDEEIAEHFAESDGDMLVFSTFKKFEGNIIFTDFGIELLNKYFPDCLKYVRRTNYIFHSNEHEHFQPAARLLQKYYEKNDLKKVIKFERKGSKVTDESGITHSNEGDDKFYLYFAVDSIPNEMYSGGYYDFRGDEASGLKYVRLDESGYKFFIGLRDLCFNSNMNDQEKIEMLKGAFPSKKDEPLPSKYSIYREFNERYNQGQFDNTNNEGSPDLSNK